MENKHSLEVVLVTGAVVITAGGAPAIIIGAAVAGEIVLGACAYFYLANRGES